MKKIFFPFNPDKLVNSKIRYRYGRLLDFGAGIDFDKERFCFGSAEGYFGYDIDEKVVKKLKEQYSFFDFWKEKDSFTTIIAKSVLEHLKPFERLKFFARCKELMWEESVLILVYPNPIGFNLLEYWKDGTHLLPPSPWMVEKQLNELGFDVETFLCGISVFPLSKLFRHLISFLMGFPIQHSVVQFARLRK